jgi:amino acid transporter
LNAPVSSCYTAASGSDGARDREAELPEREGQVAEVTAQATIEERQLLKSLNWWDGFVIALCNPGFLIASLGFTLATVGALGSVVLWGISAVVGLLQNWIYSETAAMFPDKPGGIALYAHEGWRKYFNLVGPISAFGYWIGWSVVLAIFGNLIGSLIVAEWFPGSAATVLFNSPFNVDIYPANIIGIGIVVAVWLFNIFGVRPSLAVGYVTGVLLMIPLAVFIIVPYFTGDWSSANVTFEDVGGAAAAEGFSLFGMSVMWLFIMCWSAYGIEVCATFAPEYHDTKRDTSLALRSSAAFSLAVYVLLPLGLGGVVGTAGDSGAYYVAAFKAIVGDTVGSIAIISLLASLILSMNSATADGGRALYGIARDDMTIKWLYHLNKFHVPARGMTVDMVVNVALILLLGTSNLAILYMSNIGYVTAHVFALTGFLLLRRDRPDWPRPIKVGSGWIPVVWLLAAFNLFLVVFGVTQSGLAAFVGFYEFAGAPLWIGVGVLVASVALFFYRRAVQDRKPITFRDVDVPTMPSEDQMRMLREEVMPDTSS